MSNPVKVQYFEDLNIYLVYAENRYQSPRMLYRDGQLLSNTDGWVEVKTLEGLQRKETRDAQEATYSSCDGSETLSYAEYHQKKASLELRAFYNDEDDDWDEDDEDSCKIVVDKEAYAELKLLDRWTYKAAVKEDVFVPATFETVRTNFHSKCLFLRNHLGDGDLSKAALWSYDRNKAVVSIIRDCMAGFDAEELPTSDSCISRNVPNEKKQYRFYKSNHDTTLAGLKWFSAWGASIFYEWGWACGFEHNRGQQSPIGTEAEMLALYEADKKALVDKITFEYKKRWEPASVGANQAGEILASVKAALNSLSGVRERRDSKGSTSQARLHLSKAVTLLESCIRG